MEKKFIYPKNYFYTPRISLNDSKWQLYNTTNNNSVEDKIYNNLYNNKNLNLNLYSSGITTNSNKEEIYDKDIDTKVENIKKSIYSKLSRNSSQLFISLEKIKYLTQENLSLKQIIKNKDKVISDFEVLSRQFKEKFLKMEQINQNLKNRLNNNEDINANINGKELNIDLNKRDLIDTFNKIKQDLNLTENDYNKRLQEKDEIIEKMNTELIYIYKEYKNLSDILEQMNNYIMNSDYNELKNKINNLLEEKEFLLKQNENREKRIIDLQIKNEQILSDENMNNDDLIITFKNQENEYVKTITMLQNRIIDKDKEIQMIKEEFSKIINDKERIT